MNSSVHSRLRPAVSRSRAFLASALLSLFALSFASAEDKLPFAEPADWHTLPESALIVTTMGDVEIQFYREEAPISVRNFQYLAENGRYNNVLFHAYTEDFIIQGGDVTGTGKGGPGYTLPPEISKVRHSRGVVGWARLPNPVNAERRSNGSQFYISLAENRHLNGLYTIFARVVRGMEVVEQLRRGDRIITVKLPKNFKGAGPDPNAPKPQSGPLPQSDAARPLPERPLPRRPEGFPQTPPRRSIESPPFSLPPREPPGRSPEVPARGPLVPERPPQRQLPPVGGQTRDGDTFAIPDPD